MGCSSINNRDLMYVGRIMITPQREREQTQSQNSITENIFHHALASKYFSIAHMDQMSALVRRFESLSIHDLHDIHNIHTHDSPYRPDQQSYYRSSFVNFCRYSASFRVSLLHTGVGQLISVFVCSPHSSTFAVIQYVKT